MALARNPAEMDRIRKADAILVEAARKAFVPESVEYDDKCAFIISRCVKGPQGWVGFFKVDQLITEDAKGNPLKKPFRKVLKGGIDLVIAMATIETAIRRRIFK